MPLNSTQNRSPTPSAIRRLLRQEAGFGCARCGHPWLEYHHIIPWHEEQHFRPKDMVALCRNCHPVVADLSRDRQYKIKRNPHNISVGQTRGSLVFESQDMTFRIGGTRYVNPSTIVRFFDRKVFSIKREESRVLISLELFDPEFWPVFRISDNDIELVVGAFWDFEFRHNKVVLRSAPRNIDLEIDLRGEEGAIRGRFQLLKHFVEFDTNRQETRTSGITLNVQTMHCNDNSVVVQLGDPSKHICPPNFAQLRPKVTFY